MRIIDTGFYWGDTYPARTFVAPTMAETDSFLFEGAGGPGDSGSCMINQQGEAVGVLVAGLDPRVAGVDPTVWPAGVPWPSLLLMGTRLDVQLARAQKVRRTVLRLQNADVAPLGLT